MTVDLIIIKAAGWFSDRALRCRFEEVGLTRKVVSAIVEMARSDSPEVKEAVCRAAGHLALAESQGNLPAGSAVGALVPVFVSLLSADQASDVQRRQLHVSILACNTLI